MENRGKKDPINIFPSDKKVEEGRRDRLENKNSLMLDVIMRDVLMAQPGLLIKP